MDAQQVFLREMTPQEYGAATKHRGAESVRAAAGAAWPYDINVFAPFRRRGYGSAILAAVEELIAREGKTALGLNVVGGNQAAIALYRRSGYDATSMAMRKNL